MKEPANKSEEESEESEGEEYRLWAGPSQAKLSDIAVALSESISLDKELYEEDIKGSLAHARMLRRISLLEKEDLEAIEEGLHKIRSQIEAGDFHFDPSLEDIHTHIEKALVEMCQDAGRRLHTARSRNDQIALDTHLYVLSHSQKLATYILELCRALYERAKEHKGSLLPGYTHLQAAQPIRLSHHLLAYFWSFLRDFERFAEGAQRASQLPLGSGALAGVNYATDREFLRKELGFAGIYPNSMDAVSSRDHILDFISAASISMSHASRLAEEIILWHSQGFSFIELPDHLSTGSSIMPQKKNPDLAELIRAKSSRVQANLQNLLGNLKGLPLCYNRDLQEDRFPLLDTARQTSLCMQAMTAMIKEAQFQVEAMRSALGKGFTTATDLADALVQKKKIPFRDAHRLVGSLVRRCIEKNSTLETLSLDERQKTSPHFADDSFYKEAIDLESSVEKKKSYGGTSLRAQEEQLKEAKAALSKWEAYKWPGGKDSK